MHILEFYLHYLLSQACEPKTPITITWLYHKNDCENIVFYQFVHFKVMCNAYNMILPPNM